MAEDFKRDLRLAFRPTGGVDLSVSARDLETVDGRDNLAQALMLRLMVGRGQLAGLGHPLYGSRVQELIGEPLDGPNLQLLRGYVRQALLADPRVMDVTRVEVTARLDDPGAVSVEAAVLPTSGEPIQLQVEVLLG